MKFCANNSSFSLLEKVAMNMKAISEMKHMDWDIISKVSAPTMPMPVGRGSSTLNRRAHYGRPILEITQGASKWSAIFQPKSN